MSEEAKTIPFIAWAPAKSKINTEHGVVLYEDFCNNEVARMKNGKKVIRNGDQVCVA